ncbi:MAG: hypothetical protein WC538_00360 [Thermoanaerobaculia bacterium]|jgi:hypothetical protein
MHASPVLTVALNARNGARLTRLSRRTALSRGRLVNALLTDILDSLDFKSGRDLMPRRRGERTHA